MVCGNAAVATERTAAGVSYRRHTDLFYLFQDDPQRYQNHHAAESWQRACGGANRCGGTSRCSMARRVWRTFSRRICGGMGAPRGHLCLVDVRAGRFRFRRGCGRELPGAFDGSSPTVAVGFWAASPQFRFG